MPDIDKKVFRDPSVYTSDRGLSKSDQKAPVKVTKIDASWMKASLIENERSGLIIDAANHQSFVPYQTQFETKKANSWGFVKQSDNHTPWATNSPDQIQDTVRFPIDFRGIFDVESWKAQKFETTKELYQWKTDIFGNQYGLYKDFGTPTNPKTLYEKKYSTGEFWVCNSVGYITPANTALSGVFSNHLVADPQSVYNNLTSNNIIDIDVFYDVLMVITPAEVLLDKLLFDYNTGEISSLPEYTHTITLSAATGGKFADIWFFEDSKKIVLCNVGLSAGIPIPYIHELDLETDKFDLKFPLTISDLTLVNQLSADPINTIDYPVFTYNHATNTYVIVLSTTTSTAANVLMVSMSNKEGLYKIDQVWNYSPDNPR